MRRGTPPRVLCGYASQEKAFCFFVQKNKKFINQTIKSDNMDADPKNSVLVIMRVLAHTSESISHVFPHTGPAPRSTSRDIKGAHLSLSLICGI